MSVRQTNTKLTQSQIEDLYAHFLKLDQTTPQTVDNGAPKFNKGLEIAADEWVVLDA